MVISKKIFEKKIFVGSEAVTPTSKKSGGERVASVKKLRSPSSTKKSGGKRVTSAKKLRLPSSPKNLSAYAENEKRLVERNKSGGLDPEPSDGEPLHFDREKGTFVNVGRRSSALKGGAVKSYAMTTVEVSSDPVPPGTII